MAALLVLVTVWVLVWVMVSWSLLVLVAVLVWLCVWVVVPLLVLVLDTVTLVVGEPMSEISTSMGTRTEASQAKAAPIPFTNNSELQGVPQLSSHFVSVILSASTHPNCKSWGSFEKFRKFATR